MNENLPYWINFKVSNNTRGNRSVVQKVYTKSLSATIRKCLNLLGYNQIRISPTKTADTFVLSLLSQKGATIQFNFTLKKGQILEDIEDQIWAHLKTDQKCRDKRSEVLFNFNRHKCNIKIPNLGNALSYEKQIFQYVERWNKQSPKNNTPIEITQKGCLSAVLSTKYASKNTGGYSNTNSLLLIIKEVMDDLDNLVSIHQIEPSNLTDTITKHSNIFDPICTYYKSLYNKIEDIFKNQVEKHLHSLKWAIQTDEYTNEIGEAYDRYGNRNTWASILNLVVIGESNQKTQVDEFSKTIIEEKDFVSNVTSLLGKKTHLPLFYKQVSDSVDPKTTYPERNELGILPLKTLSMSMHVLYIKVFDVYSVK